MSANSAKPSMKQAPSAWYQELTGYLLQVGFLKSVSDAFLFIYSKDTITAYFLVYVDDIILTGHDTDFLDSFVKNLDLRFSLKELGALQYLSLTRPDVCFAVNCLSQFMHSPTVLHWTALKRILHYLKATIHHGLYLRRGTPLTLQAFSDSDWGGDLNNGRFTTGYIIYLGTNPISWKSTRKKSISCSSSEVEYKATANSTTEILWVTQPSS
ncbi:hypothetical protein RJ639_031521 [Escallonia herrerae]|uniref:Reverse transcriptase Ty1/copia-type domain-containing protein n=1 Tax=Escallonia herrerae TaxID=1293975 RepID=A0AA88WZ15_9ASTE|nr:hypothetical protein RJ639_031521 [Escallonia herrerae]